MEPDDGALFALFTAIAARDRDAVARRLDQTPDLATRPIRVGASRQDAETYFLTEIGHYVYAGDTALHIAAAARRLEIAESLVVKGADVRARNRRGAEPIHYAADGGPAPGQWEADARRKMIAYLVAAGADPETTDGSGVAPLHRAVRARNTDAVIALLDVGADPRLMKKGGSTPLHLAVQNTGKGGSGSDAAKAEQRRIIVLLLAHGAEPSDTDAKGKTVEAAATSDWVRQLLGAS